MDAFIIITHIFNENILIKFNEIKHAFEKYGDTFLLIQKQKNLSSHVFNLTNVIVYDWENLKLLGYPCFKDVMIPGSNHFITLDFFRRHNKYQNYWSMEYDVDFIGEWRVLFDNTLHFSGEFLSSHIKKYAQTPNWFWWDCYYNTNNIQKYVIPLENRVKSFNPIYRISNQALSYLDYCLKE